MIILAINSTDMLSKMDGLQKELNSRCGLSGKYIDILGRYRRWLDDQGIRSEGEDGWPLPLVFEEDNITAFVDQFNAAKKEVK